MEKKEYFSPQVELYTLQMEDVITSSPTQSDPADNDVNGDF